MENRGGGRTRGRGRGTPLPALATRAQEAVNVVNRYHVLGQLPRPFNLVLASQSKVYDPIIIYGPKPQPILVSLNYESYRRSRT